MNLWPLSISSTKEEEEQSFHHHRVSFDYRPLKQNFIYLFIIQQQRAIFRRQHHSLSDETRRQSLKVELSRSPPFCKLMFSRAKSSAAAAGVKRYI